MFNLHCSKLKIKNLVTDFVYLKNEYNNNLFNKYY